MPQVRRSKGLTLRLAPYRKDGEYKEESDVQQTKKVTVKV